VVLQMHGVSPRIKVHHLDPSVDGSIRIVQQFEQVFQLYHMMLKVLKETKRQLLSQCFCKETKNTERVLQHCLFGEEVQSIMHGGILEPNPCKEQGMDVPTLYKDRKISFKHTVLSCRFCKCILEL
jgi:hypothetical protein